MDNKNLSIYFKKLYIRPLGHVPLSLRSQSYTDLQYLTPLGKTSNILSFAACALYAEGGSSCLAYALPFASQEASEARALPFASQEASEARALTCAEGKARASLASCEAKGKARASLASCEAKGNQSTCLPLLLTIPAVRSKQGKHTCCAKQATGAFVSLLAQQKEQKARQGTTKQLQSLVVAKQPITPILQTHFPFFNGSFDKKRLKMLLSWYYANKGEAAALDMVETLQKVGFSYAMKAGISLGVDDLKVPTTKVQFLEEAVEALSTTKAAVYNGSVTPIEEFQQFIDTWHRTSESLKQSVVQNFTMGLLGNKKSSSDFTVSCAKQGLGVSCAYEVKQGLASALPSAPVAKQEHNNSEANTKQDKNSAILEKNCRSYGDTLNPVYMMAFSGARGNLSQVRQLVGMRGLMADPQGQLVEFPIQSNFREGLTVTEYMISCYGARKGLVDTALRTAAAGYLTRRLVDVSHHQVVRSVTCSTKDGIFYKGRGTTTFAIAAPIAGKKAKSKHAKVKPKPEEIRNTALPTAWKITFKQQNNRSSVNATTRPSQLLPLLSKGSKLEASEGNTAVFAFAPIEAIEAEQGATAAFACAKQVAKQSKKHREVKETHCESPLISCVGRVLARDIPGVAFRNQEIDISLSSVPLLREVYENFGIYIRSPLTCKESVGICQLCYGWSVSANQLVGIGEAVGVIAAQSIGEPGTQLTMRTFHTGGVFSGDIMEECRAKHPGRVYFHGAYLGLLVRTEGGRIAFCIKTPGILQVRGFQQEVCTSYNVAANSLLFVRQGEEVSTDSLLAQIPNLPTLEQKSGESTKTISSALSGEIRETPTISEKLGNIRILSGQKEPSILRMLPGSHRLGTCSLPKLVLQSKSKKLLPTYSASSLASAVSSSFDIACCAVLTTYSKQAQQKGSCAYEVKQLLYLLRKVSKSSKHSSCCAVLTTCIANSKQAQQAKDKFYRTRRKTSSFSNSFTKKSQGKINSKFANVQSYPLLQGDKQHTKQKFLRYNKIFSDLSLKILSTFYKTPERHNTTNEHTTKSHQGPVISSLNSVAGELFCLQGNLSKINPPALPSSYSLLCAFASSLAKQAIKAQETVSIKTAVASCLPFASLAEQEASTTVPAMSSFSIASTAMQEQGKQRQNKSLLTHYDRVSYNLLQKEESINKSDGAKKEVYSVTKQIQALCLTSSLASSFAVGAVSAPSVKVLKQPAKQTLGQQKVNLPRIGAFISQREEIVKDLGCSYCGQIIEKSSSQITLRLVQNILYANYSRRLAKVRKDLENWVCKGTPVVTLPYSNSITGDIVAGIPKIEQLFEARGEALDKAVETMWASYEFAIRPRSKAVRECLKEIGLFVVQAIQKVYLSQGVHIADKHLEVIVRQMTRRACIVDPGDTSFLSEEFVDLQTIECVNWTTYGKRAAYKPRLIGITRASLNSNSFLSSASFQQTARVLERESFKDKTDRLLGLKERVMIGALIAAGTGGFRPEVRLNNLSNIYNFSSTGLKQKKEKAEFLLT